MINYHSREQQNAIGTAVLAARALGVKWKLLEERFDRSRISLWRYARHAAAIEKDVSIVSHETIETSAH